MYTPTIIIIIKISKCFGFPLKIYLVLKSMKKGIYNSVNKVCTQIKFF